jgi:Fe-S-cluster formation regulator IscX/YfhJ
MSEAIEQKPLEPEEIRKALTAMHYGILNLQERVDDHEKVLEKLLLVMQELTSGKVPDGFRQPKAN